MTSIGTRSTTPAAELPTAALVERARARLEALCGDGRLDQADADCFAGVVVRLHRLAAAEDVPAHDAYAQGRREGALAGAAEQAAKDLALVDRLHDAMRAEHRVATLSARGSASYPAGASAPPPPPSQPLIENPPLWPRIRRLFLGGGKP